MNISLNTVRKYKLLTLVYVVHQQKVIYCNVFSADKLVRYEKSMGYFINPEITKQIQDISNTIVGSYQTNYSPIIPDHLLNKI